jgi:hypothetical protein
LILIDEIKQGSVKSTVKILKINEIINLIDKNENYDSLSKLY